jgi:hypothetical protein
MSSRFSPAAVSPHVKRVWMGLDAGTMRSRCDDMPRPAASQALSRLPRPCPSLDWRRRPFGPKSLCGLKVFETRPPPPTGPTSRGSRGLLAAALGRRSRAIARRPRERRPPMPTGRRLRPSCSAPSLGRPNAGLAPPFGTSRGGAFCLGQNTPIPRLKASCATWARPPHLMWPLATWASRAHLLTHQGSALRLSFWARRSRPMRAYDPPHEACGHMIPLTKHAAI